MHPTATAKTRRARSEYLDLPQKDWNMMIYPTKMMLYPRKTFDFTIPTEECDEKCVEKRRFPNKVSVTEPMHLHLKKNIQNHNFQVWNNSKLPRHLKKTTQSCSKKTHVCRLQDRNKPTKIPHRPWLTPGLIVIATTN